MRESIRIGYVLKRFPRFSETFILNELLALQDLGADLSVFSLLKPPDEPRHARLANLRAPVTNLSRAGRLATPNMVAAAAELADHPLFVGDSPDEIAALQLKAAAVARTAQERGIRHLHAHFGSDATTVALLAARIIGGTFSYTAHARDIYHTYVSPEADLARRRVKLMEAAFTVTVSDFNCRHLAGLCPEAAGHIHRLYNGIDLNYFRPAPAPMPGRIVAVGRLVPKKGFPVLIEACRLMRDRGLAFEVLIIGDGPEEAALSARIEAVGLGGHVRLEGPRPQEELVPLVASAAIAVLPCVVTPDGDRDGLPTVLLEAMASAVPVVTTTVTGGPEIVEDGVTGLLCPPGDAAALADRLGQLLAAPARAREMGRAGRRRAEALFDLSRNAATLLDHFHAVAAPTLREAV